MGPSEIQVLLHFEPFVPLRLTMSSGDIVEIRFREEVTITGLSLLLNETTSLGRTGSRIVSLPNINLVEPIPTDLDGRRRPQGGEE